MEVTLTRHTICTWILYIKLYIFLLSIIIDPLLLSWCPVNQLLLLEPQPHFSVSILHAVAAMYDVPAGDDSKVSSYGARASIGRVGGPHHGPSGGHQSHPLPAHGHHWARLDVLHQTREKWSLLR